MNPPEDLDGIIEAHLETTPAEHREHTLYLRRTIARRTALKHFSVKVLTHLAGWLAVGLLAYALRRLGLHLPGVTG